MAIDILGFGSVAVDELLYVDAFPPADGKVRVSGRERRCGGLAGVALLAAARLGARCAYAGRLGTDTASLSAPITDQTNGLCPCCSFHGW